jgi:tRNA-modifying protein YgfZ
MSLPFAALLPNRSVVRLAGADRHSFLQGLISNDIQKVTSSNAIYAALLTPQGKFLHDMFILEQGDAFLIDCESERLDDFVRRLTAYKLRSKVTIEPLSATWDVWAIWNAPYKIGTAFIDPRLDSLGSRLFIEKGKAPLETTIIESESYDEHRLAQGVSDGSSDLDYEKSTLAEGNFDYLNGIDWKKGCYVGQELTARMHYRGLAKKRLFPVKIEGDAPDSGTLIDGDKGEMRTHSGKAGLALLRVEAAQDAVREEKPLTIGETRIWPLIPPWMKIDVKGTNR